MNKLQKRQSLEAVKLAAFKAILILSVVGMSQFSQAQEEKLKNTQQEQIKVDDAAKASQERVSKTAEETKTIVDEYRASLRKIENTKVYNEQLRKLIESQKEEMVSVKDQTESIKNTNKEIFPLMSRMITSLVEFVKLDLPFLPEERTNRLKQIEDTMDNAKVSTSEKFRRVIEAYQVENEYGRTIEAYRGIQKVDGKDLTVDFLRFGRISLVYQTLDGKKSGYWDQKERAWKPLSSSYRKAVQEGLQIARKQSAPSLVKLPVPAPEGVQVETL